MGSTETSARPRRALLIATDQYNDEGLAELRAPQGDVSALAEVLSHPDIGGFDVRTPIVNQPRDDVCEEIEDFFDVAGKDDLLLLYLSGHGVLSSNRSLYFATPHTKLRRLRATGIPASFINEVMEHSRSRRIVLMLDCCHSGAFPQSAAKGTKTVDVGGRFDGQGRVTLSASTELEYAYEGDQLVGTGAAGSLFTRMAVEGLRTGEADVDNDGKVTIDELYDYVYDRVRDETRYQTPELTGKVRGDLLIATSPRVVVPELPEALRKELEDPIKSRRLGAVYELVRLLQGDDTGMQRAAEQQLRSMSTEDDSDSVKSAAASALLDYGSSEESPPKVSQAGSDGSPPNGPSADGSSDEGTGAALEPEPTPVSPPAPRAPTASPGTTRSSIVWAFLAALGTAFGLLPLAYFTFRTAQRLDREGRKGWGAVLWLLGAIAVLWGIVMIVAYANSGNTQ